jgi:hypothetical protein
MAYKKASMVAATAIILLLLGGSAGVIGILPGQKGGILGKKRQVDELRQQVYSAKTVALPAILGFAQAHNNEVPATLAEMQSYLPAGSGIDDEHWELVAAGAKVDPAFLRQKNLVLMRQKNIPPGQPMIVGYADGHFEIRKSGR